MAGSGIREPVSAGSRGFYPSHPETLRATLIDLFRDLPEQQEIEPIALIAPHAGYVFSGRTAAHAYKLLEGRIYDRVVILAPSHYAAFPGASVFQGIAFASALGQIPLDNDFIAKLREESDLFDYCPEAEAREHSLEVQAPFLQSVLQNFSLVPVVIGDIFLTQPSTAELILKMRVSSGTTRPGMRMLLLTEAFSAAITFKPIICWRSALIRTLPGWADSP